MEVGFLGLGTMGLPMARNMARAGMRWSSGTAHSRRATTCGRPARAWRPHRRRCSARRPPSSSCWPTVRSPTWCCSAAPRGSVTSSARPRHWATAVRTWPRSFGRSRPVVAPTHPGGRHGDGRRPRLPVRGTLAHPEQPCRPGPKPRHHPLRHLVRHRLRPRRRAGALRRHHARLAVARRTARALLRLRPRDPGAGGRRRRRRARRGAGPRRPPGAAVHRVCADPTPSCRSGWVQLAGNHVLIETPAGAVVALCHLRRGSVSVRPGEGVRPGEPLGRCGNSGNSTEPHVHVQAIDGVDVLHASAVPITFDGRVPRNGEVVDASEERWRVTSAPEPADLARPGPCPVPRRLERPAAASTGP